MSSQNKQQPSDWVGNQPPDTRNDMQKQFDLEAFVNDLSQKPPGMTEEEWKKQRLSQATLNMSDANKKKQEDIFAQYAATQQFNTAAKAGPGRMSTILASDLTSATPKTLLGG